MTLQCFAFSNMIGRSAMFCAAMETIDQMRSERIADVFQAVKAIRVHLPGAVENKVCLSF